MNECDQYQADIGCFIDGESVDDGAPRMFEHLSACKRCSDFLYDVIQIRIGAATEGKVPAPSDLDTLMNVRGHKTLRRYASDAPLLHSNSRDGVGISARTLTLAILVFIMGCLMFSTNVSFRGGGAVAPQSSQDRGAR
jgi:hypothetical protein